MPESEKKKPSNSTKEKGPKKGILSNRVFQIASLIAVVIILILILGISIANNERIKSECYECHSEYAQLAKLKYVHTAFKSDSCTRCHTKHTKDKTITTFTKLYIHIWDQIVGKKSTGKTFIRYVNELRVGHACRLLIETEFSIAEICYQVGFNNVSNFNRRFRELHLMSPKQYRHEFTLNR